MLLRIAGQETSYYGMTERVKQRDIAEHKLEELFQGQIGYTAEELIDFEEMIYDLEGEEIRDMLHILRKIDKDYYIKFDDGPCIFQEGNTAMITQDEHGIVRYTSNNKADNTYFYLSTTDILSITWKITSSEVAKRIALMMNIECQEIQDMEDEKRFKLEHNKKILDTQFFSEDYETTQRLLGKTGREILLFLNDEAERKLVGNKYRTEAGFFFFASIRHIGLMVEKGVGVVSNAVHLLEALGFIRTLAEEEIPEDVLSATQRLMKEKHWVKMPNFYIINKIDNELLYNAEETAQLLLERGLKPGRVSVKKLISILGNDYRRR